MLSIISLLFIIPCSIIIIKSVVDATTISSRNSTPKNSRIIQATTLLEDRELQLFDTTTNNSAQVQEKMEGTCYGNQLDSGQQRSQGSYLWYVSISLSNNILSNLLAHSPFISPYISLLSLSLLLHTSVTKS